MDRINPTLPNVLCWFSFRPYQRPVRRSCKYLSYPQRKTIQLIDSEDRHHSIHPYALSSRSSYFYLQEVLGISPLPRHLRRHNGKPETIAKRCIRFTDCNIDRWECVSL